MEIFWGTQVFDNVIPIKNGITVGNYFILGQKDGKFWKLIFQKLLCKILTFNILAYNDDVISTIISQHRQ